MNRKKKPRQLSESERRKFEKIRRERAKREERLGHGERLTRKC